MADIQATNLRRGTTVVIDGVVFRVLEFEHRTPGNKRGFVQTKLRNLIDGTQRTVKFSASEFLERAIVDVREMDYLYADADAHVFMDAETYEQISIPSSEIEDVVPWLTEGMRLMVEMFESRPIGVRLPKVVEAEVTETEAVVRGQTAAKSTKPATLTNGVVIQVPQFINAGERIRVDPGEQRYVERVK